MERFSVSVDEELAEWVETQAEERGVSKAKVIRDAVATARVAGFVEDNETRPESGDLLDRVEALEARVSALEDSRIAAEDREQGDVGEVSGIVAAFTEQLAGRPPRTEHGKAAIVDVFILLLEAGPMETAELREAIYPGYAEEFCDAESMWQAIQRYFEEIPGIEKVDRGTWDADPAAVQED